MNGRKICALFSALLLAMPMTGCEKGEKSVERPVPTYDANSKVIALTFDDGPNATTTNEILDILEENGVVASFFLIGNNITEETESTVKRAYDLGCEINNHSQTHSYMNQMEAEDIAAEIGDTNAKIEAITGETAHFFRPPYIAVNDTMWETIELPFIAGYGVNDYMDSVTADARYQGVMDQADDGVIILLHDAQGNSRTVEAVKRLVPDLLAEGYTFVTVSQLLDAKGIAPQSRIIYSYAAQTTMYG